jgi:protein-tyrosine-phosphatase
VKSENNKIHSLAAECRRVRHDSDDRYEVVSAGICPSHVRPESIAFVRELGIDISRDRSKSVDE